jgi:prophage antirepressor-like protein
MLMKKKKKTLKELVVSLSETTNFLGKIDHNLSYNDGKVTFISESGLYNLIIHSNAPFEIEAWKWLKEIIPQYKPNIKLNYR